MENGLLIGAVVWAILMDILTYWSLAAYRSVTNRTLFENKVWINHLVKCSADYREQIAEFEERIAELENKFAPTEMITGNLEDLAIMFPKFDPQYVWPNIGYAEISSTLDRQSGPPVA